jgi:hypothetical protein
MKPVVWCEEGVEDVSPHDVTCRWFYFAWPDGGSLAFVVPMHKGHRARKDPKAEEADSGPPERVFISVAQQEVYDNETKLCDFPPRDNRCYILGKDLTLRDSGRSAEWLLGPTTQNAQCRGVVIDVAERENSKTLTMRPEGSPADIEGGVIDVPGGGRVTLLLPNCRYGDQRADFFDQAASLAFEREIVYCPPWDALRLKEGKWCVDPVVTSEVAPPDKWDARPIRERPNNWESAYPKDDWRELLKACPPDLPST